MTQEMTYSNQTTTALPYGGTAADEAYDEEKCSNSDDDHRRDEGIDVLKEMIIVVICYKNVCTDVAQYPCSSLETEHKTDINRV